MGEDFKDAIIVLMIIGGVCLFVMSPFILMATYSLLESPEHICAEQQQETDFCKSLLNNPNLLLKK